MKYRRKTTTLKGDKTSGVRVEITPQQEWDFEGKIGLNMCYLSLNGVFIVVSKQELTTNWERV
jgi:hypothetical protein